MASIYDQIVRLVEVLSYPDLKRLQQVVNTLVETGYQPAQGSLDYRFVTRSGKRYGPYKYRRLWQAGKLVDHYDGKASLEEYQRWLAQKAPPLVPGSPKEDNP